MFHPQNIATRQPGYRRIPPVITVSFCLSNSKQSNAEKKRPLLRTVWTLNSTRLIIESLSSWIYTFRIILSQWSLVTAHVAQSEKSLIRQNNWKHKCRCSGPFPPVLSNQNWRIHKGAFCFSPFAFFPYANKQNHSICSSNSAPLLCPGKGFPFFFSEKVTGIKKIDGMSQEDLKLY